MVDLRLLPTTDDPFAPKTFFLFLEIFEILRESLLSLFFFNWIHVKRKLLNLSPPWIPASTPKGFSRLSGAKKQQAVYCDLAEHTWGCDKIHRKRKQRGKDALSSHTTQQLNSFSTASSSKNFSPLHPMNILMAAKAMFRVAGKMWTTFVGGGMAWENE